MISVSIKTHASIIAGLMLFSASAHAQQFWRGTRAGMTKAQVQAVLQDRLDGDRMTYQFCGESFTVAFGFDRNAKLVDVTLSSLDFARIVQQNSLDRLHGAPTVSIEEAQRNHDATLACLVAEYKRAYGPPADDDHAGHLIFKRGDTVVAVSAADLTPLIEYTVRNKSL